MQQIKGKSTEIVIKRKWQMLLFSQRTNITSIITRSFQKRKNMTCNLESDGCPNLLCQREESVLAEVAAEKELETVLKL